MTERGADEPCARIPASRFPSLSLATDAGRARLRKRYPALRRRSARAAALTRQCERRLRCAHPRAAHDGRHREHTELARRRAVQLRKLRKLLKNAARRGRALD
jgi:hypothetical protein